MPCSTTSARAASPGRFTSCTRALPVIDGIPAVTSFADLPAPVDLAVIAVPAAACSPRSTDAADAGVPAAVVISSGFQELGADGARLQHELAALARAREHPGGRAPTAWA